MSLDTNADIAARVRGAAAEHGLSYGEVAKVLGVSPMSVTRRMRGETPFTGPELLCLAEVMDEPITRFFPEPVSRATPEAVAA